MKAFIIIVFSMVFWLGCDKKPDDPIIPNQEEVITTLTYTLTPKGGGPSVKFVFKDLDGNGGNAPVITNGVLDTNATYSGRLELLNEQESPAGDITKEVEEESAEHQFFYELTATGVTIEYRDKDASGKPLGVETELKTTFASKGKIKIILRHEPNKSAAGVFEGKITNAGGETDIEVEFNLEVK